MNIKKIRKEIEAEKARKAIEIADQYDAGDATDSLQNTINRMIATTDKINDKAINNENNTIELNKGNFDVNGDGTKITKIFDANGDLDTPIKDLTHLTTQDELYNAMELHKSGYKIKIGDIEYITLTSTTKTATLVETIVANVSGSKIQHKLVVAHKDSSSAIVSSGVEDYETVKYVDEEIAKIVVPTVNTDMVVTFDDGTTATYKVGS